MKTPDKQWSEQKDKDRNKAERDKMRKEQSEQQQSQEQGSDQQGGGQQGGWGSDQDRQKEMGRKPPIDRDRDYDPDGDRVGRTPERP